MDTSIDVKRCAAVMRGKYRIYDTYGKTALESGLRVLDEVSRLWKDCDEFDASLCERIMTDLAGRPLSHQANLFCLLGLLMGNTKWWQITEEEWQTVEEDWQIAEEERQSNRFLYFPLVWAFRIDLKRLYTAMEVRDLTAMQTLEFEQKLWLHHHGLGFVEIPDLHMFGCRLQIWGGAMALRVGPLEDFTHNEVQRMCARALTNTISPHNPPYLHNIETGLSILHQTSKIWFQVKETEKMCRALTTYISSLPRPTQQSLNILIGTLAGCEDWVQADRQAVSSGRFRVSAVMLILKVSPVEFAGGWPEGRMTGGILEEVDEEIAVLLEEEASTRLYFEGLARWLYGWNDMLVQ